MMFLRRAMGLQDLDLGPTPPKPDPTMTNPVGTSQMFPPAMLTNPSPQFDPMLTMDAMTREQRLGAMQTRGTRGRPPLASDLPALQAQGQQFLDDGMAVAGATMPIGQGIRAFHGSPHTFDRFQLSKIGTGEGAQAYGHGLYFAGNEKVAKSYRDMLSGPTMPPDYAAAMQQKAKIQARMDALHETMVQESIAKGAKIPETWGTLGVQPLPEVIAKYQDEWGTLVKQSSEFKRVIDTAKPIENPGSMYEVSLRTSPERLLDWDAPLSAQPAGALINDIVPGKQWRLEPTAGGKKFNILSPGGWQVNEFPGAYGEARARQIVEEMNAKSSGLARTGQQIAPRSPDAVQRFLDAGIDGVQYLDGGSRAAGEGSRNYVMFDDKLIDILRRYGLFGLGMMGAAGGTAQQFAPQQPPQSQ